MIEQIRKKFLFIPLILVEVYLVFTLLLYQFGPLDWQTENEPMFWCFILFYHLAFIAGYVFSIKRINLNKPQWNTRISVRGIESWGIWLMIAICIVCACIEYRNITFADSYIPYELPKNFINGLINPAEQYYNKFLLSQSYSPSKIITIVSALFSFVYMSLIPFLIVKWKKINLLQKICFFALIFFKVAIYVSVGTNKGIFDILFSFAAILAVLFLLNLYHGNEENIDKPTLFKVAMLVGILVVFSFGYFTMNISSRVASPVEYAISMTQKEEPKEEVKEPQQEIQEEIQEGSDSQEENDKNEVGEELPADTTQDEEIKEDIKEEENITKKPDGFVKKMFYSVTNYLTQGYYGMSLSIDEEFTSTYGIGNSQFLSSNFKSIFGIDVQNRTYQHKITEQWHESQQWHSFYSYIANDISFYGVIVFMLVLGIYYGCICKDVILNGSLVGKMILPLFVIMFMYMPANNQIFTAMATCTAFIELTFLWVVSKINWKKGKKHE